MSLTSVLTKRYVSYPVKTLTESYVKGKLTRSESSASVELCIIPISFRDLQAAPEGTFDLQDIKIYVESATTIEDKSIVTYKGRDYSVRSFADRTDNGGFKIYIGKLIDD